MLLLAPWRAGQYEKGKDVLLDAIGIYAYVLRYVKHSMANDHK